jgi:uncharacterized protein with HEPN domain
MLEQWAMDRLELIEETLDVIEAYQKHIKAAEDFYTEQGSIIYDAIVMRLQVLGENIKTIYKSTPGLFSNVDTEVISIIRFRDLISHHYEKLDTEVVYDICTQYVPILRLQIKELLKLYK